MAWLRALVLAALLTAGIAALTLNPSPAQAQLVNTPCRIQQLQVLNVAGIAPALLSQVELATELEVNLSLHAYWGTPCIEFGNSGWPVVIAPPGVATDLSYHNASPAAYVWTIDGRGSFVSNGDTLPWTVVFSHEIMEMLVNPTVHGQLNGFPLEVCDPVLLIYVNILGIPLQDFVTPAWFGSSRGPWDAVGVLGAPFADKRSGAWTSVTPGAAFRAHLPRSPGVSWRR